MVYLLLLIAILSIKDIMYLRSKKKKKDSYVYIAIILLVSAFAIFYYSNPQRASFAKMVLSLIGKEG